MRACAAWLRWCCCGCCGACEKGAGGDAKGLLPNAISHDELALKETTYYSYDVRRISSSPEWMHPRSLVHPSQRKQWATAGLKQLHLGDTWSLVSTKEWHRMNQSRQPRSHRYRVLQITKAHRGFGRGESKEKDAWSDGETVGYEPLGNLRGRSVTPAPPPVPAPSSTPPAAPAAAFAKVFHPPPKGGTSSPTGSLSPAPAHGTGGEASGRPSRTPVRDSSRNALCLPVWGKDSWPTHVMNDLHEGSSHSSTKTIVTYSVVKSPSQTRVASTQTYLKYCASLTHEAAPALKGVDENYNIGAGSGGSGGGGGGEEGGDDGGGDVEDSRRRAPWHAALRRFKPSPARSRSKSPRPGSATSTGGGGGGGERLHPLARLAPSLAISTPDLAKRSKLAVSGPRSIQTLGVPSRIRGASSSCLPRALTVEAERTNVDQRRSAARSEAYAEDRHGRWSRNRSMESVDYETEPSTPVADDVFQDEGDSVSLARSLGLDKNLYVTQRVGSFTSSKQPTSWSSSVCSTPSINVESYEGGRTPIKVEDCHYFASVELLNNQEIFVDQPCGTVTFSASYYQKNKKLCIELDQLDNLPPKGKGSVYDVIVRLSIFPSDKQLKSTQIHRGSLSPLIKEDFNFNIKDPVGKIMRFTVFNSMYQGKHDAIGYACFNVDDVISGKPRKYSMKLTRRSQPGPNCGSLQIYLQLSEQQRLIVDVIQARNLCSSSLPKNSTDSFSTYIKMTFYSAGQKVKSKKSSVVTCDRNPQYEFSSDFKIVPEHLDSCYIAVSVVLKVSLRKDVTLGRYILGPNFFSGNQEITPWGRALLKREQVCHWFNLYL